MNLSGTEFSVSPTDLSNFHNCRHLIGLEMAHARGTRRRPYYDDPRSEALRERGLEHEAAYVRTLTAGGRSLIDLRETKDRAAATAQTLEAMRAGIHVIVQGALMNERRYGRPDVLLRNATPSQLGGWSYEVVDTKLARETRAGSLLQLVLYCEMLAIAQGHRPEIAGLDRLIIRNAR
jgi:uncharacterized protein